MHNAKKIFILLTLIIFTLCLNINKANAISIYDSADNVFGIDLVLNERANIDGDAILFGETVKFAGSVKGNVISIGNKVDVVTDNMRNAIAIAKDDVNLKGDARAVYAIGRNVKVNSNTKSMYVLGKFVNISGVIDGDLTVVATKIEFAPDLKVNGILKIESPIEPEYPSGIVSNNVTYKKVEEEVKKETVTSKLWRLSQFLLWLVPTGLVTAVIYVKLLGPVKRKGTLLLKKFPLKVFLYGFLMLICIPSISLLFMIAVIGLPTALIILMVYMICILIAVPSLGVAIGELILPNQADYISGIIGTLIVSLAVAIPYVGVIIYFVALLYTYGMFSILIFDLARKEHRRGNKKFETKSIVKKLKTKINKKDKDKDKDKDK